MTLYELLSSHVGEYASINDCGVVCDGEPNLEVTIWETKYDARNDDGSNAITRELVYGEQPALISNGDVVEIDNDLLDEVK